MKIKLILFFFITLCSFGQTSEQLFNKGLKQDENGNYKEAIVSFTNSYNLSIREKNKQIESLSLANRGMAKSEIKDFLGAIDDYDKFILIDNKNPNIHFLKSLCLMEIKNYENALATISLAIELDKSNYDYYLFRASMKDEIKDYKGAISDCIKATNLNLKDGFCYAIMGSCKLKLGVSKFEVCLDFKKGMDLGNKDCEDEFKKNCR